jgi:hypothetical protein
MKIKSNMTVKDKEKKINNIRENLVDYFSLFQSDMTFWRVKEKEITPLAILTGIIVSLLFLIYMVIALITYPIRKWLNIYFKQL